MPTLPSPDSSSPNNWPLPANYHRQPTLQTKAKPKPKHDPIPPFRNVSACNRCRIRKHRCDQRLPRCEPCEKAQVRCVGYDPLTKQEVPRSYVAFLESRVNYLNQVLREHNIAFKPALPYDEEEARKMETGPPGRGLEGWREPEVGLRKRKAETVPARQMKRLAQLNVLLTELITDGCVHGECERGSGERPWSPRSLDSGERERGTPEVESPGEGDLGKGGRVGSEGGKVGPGVESGMGDCEIDVKPFVKDGRVDERVNSSGHSQKEGSAEPKFDLAADLLRGRMERQKERDTFDLLDEFLVDWTE